MKIIKTDLDYEFMAESLITDKNIHQWRRIS